MAGFKTHITTSSLLGVGYGAIGTYLGLPWESAVVAGAMCGIGGMLPDIDSDSGIPFRESMSFAAAVVPVLLLPRLQQLGLNHEQFVLAVGCSYAFVRFGLAKMLAKYTVHRGMFHSLPAVFIFSGLAFLFSNSDTLQLRYFKAIGVFLGVMSHLTLDEIYSVEFAGGRWRLKKSSGTAIKLWGQSTWANVTTYGKLALVYAMILGEPMVTEKYGEITPLAINRREWCADAVSELQNLGYGNLLPMEGAAPTGFAQQQPVPGQWPPPQGIPTQGTVTPWSGGNFAAGQVGIEPLPPTPESDRTIYDTARRLWQSLGGAK